MSTRAIVAYKTTDGEVRGAYVHNDGDPEQVLDVLLDRFARIRYQGMINWIEQGIADAGFRAIEDERGYQDEDSKVYGLHDGEYGYLVVPVSRSEYGAPIIETHHNGRIESVTICVTD